jgi:hypothetical protein
MVSPYPSILYIILYPLWGPLVTLSKYIHVTSCFKVFIETNLMVQSEFNLIFCLRVITFFLKEIMGPAVHALSLRAAYVRYTAPIALYLADRRRCRTGYRSALQLHHMLCAPLSSLQDAIQG